MTASEAFERFLAFERRTGVGRREVCGVCVWPLVRFAVYSNLILPAVIPMGHPHPDMGMRSSRKGGFFPKLLRRVSALLWRLRYSPSCARDTCDILFSLTPREMTLPDGRRVSQLLDFFLSDLHPAYAVLEGRGPCNSYPPHRWRRVFHLDGYQGRLEDHRRQLRKKAAVAVRAFAEECAAGLAAEFGVPVDVESLFQRLCAGMAFRSYYYPLFRQWLRRLQVKCVVTVVNYARVNLVLGEAAHDEGIPVVELQHGTVYPAHAAYNLPDRDTAHSPDYLFAWGQHWAEQTRNYALRKTICTGYPVMEWMRCHYPVKEGGDIRKIVFISQGTIGGELSRYAVDLAKGLSRDRYAVVYKLHPNESKSWRTLYPWLDTGEVEVVSSAERSIYELFGEAYATVGVYSTAVIEGLMWGVRAYVFADLPGGDTMTPFLAVGLLEKVSSAEDLAKRLQSADAVGRKERIDGSRFWESGSALRIVSALEEIVKNGELK